MIRFHRNGNDYIPYKMGTLETILGAAYITLLSKDGAQLVTSDGENIALPSHGDERFIWRLVDWGVDFGSGVFKPKGSDGMLDRFGVEFYDRIPGWEHKPGPACWIIVDCPKKTRNFFHANGKFYTKDEALVGCRGRYVG